MNTPKTGGATSSSERTYGQRYTKGVAVYDMVKNEAGYDPTENALIQKGPLKVFLDGLDAANKQVANLTPAYNNAQDARVVSYHGVEGLIKRAATVREVLGGYQDGKKSTAFGTVQRLVQEMSNYRKPKKEVADGVDVEATTSTAQTSFGSLLLKGWEVLGVMKDLGAGYVTKNPLVTVAAFEQFLQDTAGLNTTIAEALKPLNAAIREREALVEGPEGLTVRIAAVKSYVAGEMAGGKMSNLHKELVKVRYQ